MDFCSATVLCVYVCSLDKLEYHAGEVMKLRLRVDCPSAIKPRISHLSLQVCHSSLHISQHHFTCKANMFFGRVDTETVFCFVFDS